jgi:hypothetical protein
MKKALLIAFSGSISQYREATRSNAKYLTISHKISQQREAKRKFMKIATN